MRRMTNEYKRLVRLYLADEGVKIFQKDIKNIEVNPLDIVRHREGIFEGYFYHKDLYRVEMRDGTVYEFTRETVDENGNYSTNSAYFATRKLTVTKAS